RWKAKRWSDRLEIWYCREHIWRRCGSWRCWNKCKIGSGLRLIIDITGLTIYACERDDNQIISINHVWSVRYREIEDHQTIACSCCDLSVSIAVSPFNGCLCIGSTDTDRIAIHIVNEVSVHRNLTPRIEGWCGVDGPGTAQIWGNCRYWRRIVVKAEGDSDLWLS